jgi:hypothetical protein
MSCREDVWLTLSELWLDTELDQPALRYIAKRLRSSGLSQAELQHIYCYEVAPQVWLNHWVVAGVWDGFEPHWLFAGCRRHQCGGRWHRLKCRLLHRPMTYGCRAEWQQVLAYLAEPGACA